MLEFFRSVFGYTYQSEIEEFILSKNPKNTADVEHWIQVYNYGKSAEKHAAK